MKQKKKTTKRIEDEFTHLPLSRQRKYQLRMRRQGRCTICGKPATTAIHCRFHAVKAREQRRAKLKVGRRCYGVRSYELPHRNGDGGEGRLAGRATRPASFDLVKRGAFGGTQPRDWDRPGRNLKEANTVRD